MDNQRVLREAQLIAAKFSFWMVSGNINHLFGYAYETSEKKYELEIKFDDRFPDIPPDLTFHDDLQQLLGEVKLSTIVNWSPESHVIYIIQELKAKIEQALNIPSEIKKPVPAIQDSTTSIQKPIVEPIQTSEEEYITPDLNAYPPDFDYEQYNVPSESPEPPIFEKESTNIAPPSESESKSSSQDEKVKTESSTEKESITPPELFADHEQTSVVLSTELGLLQQEYAYDQISAQNGDINVYLTITLSKTFLIHINFNKYPERPLIEVPDEVKKIIGDPYQSLHSLGGWNKKSPGHIIDILHELEKRLYFINDIELQANNIIGEYRCDIDPENLTHLTVHLVTYGFNEYTLDINLDSLPQPPVITLSPELQQIIMYPVDTLSSYKDWKDIESEAVELIRELAWLVDKHSRINFEIELLKEHFKEIEYEASSSILKVAMKGKMKTQDLTFNFQIDLPNEYPMKVPTIKIVNEFDIESHEKIKHDLQSSFKDFFDEWTPYSYLVDLFNAISKKIFEVSVVSCVICHKIDCPTCSLKIAGSVQDNCHTDCPYCERSYHKHCWEQTIKSFGKCGFCLKTPPPDML